MANESILRLAHFSDLVGIQALYQELRPDDAVLTSEKAQQTLIQLLANPAIKLVVAEIAQCPVATCMLAIVPGLVHGAQPFGIIEHVVTAQAHRGKGIGRSMMQFTLQLAWQADCYKVVLLSGQQRAEAHQLYLRVGFNGDRERGFVIKKPAEEQ